MKVPRGSIDPDWLRSGVTEAMAEPSVRAVLRRAGIPTDVSEIAMACEEWANPTSRRDHDSLGRAETKGASPQPLPLNLDGDGYLAFLQRDGARARCSGLVSLGGGRFVHGPDNTVFGRWNTLAVGISPQRCLVFAAHGGEILPGRLDDHVERLRRVRDSGWAPPVQVDFDVSMACPSACSFCFSADYRKARSGGKSLDPDLMLELIGQWAREGVKLVRFDGGGDPLAHPHITKAIDRCNDEGMSTAVLTAGDLLSDRHLSSFLRARTYLRVSLNAATDATRVLVHRQRGGRLGVSHILEKVSRLSRSRSVEFGSRAKEYMPIGGTFMIHPENAHEVAAAARSAQNAGFDHISFRVVLGDRHRVRFTPEQKESLEHQFAEVRARADADFQAFLPSRALTDTGYVPSAYFSTCRASTQRALVEVGDRPDRPAVVPCGRYRGHGYVGGDDGVVLGHLDGGSTLRSVYTGSVARSRLELFPSSCGDCIDRSANVMLERMAGVIDESPNAHFFRFSARVPPEGGLRETGVRNQDTNVVEEKGRPNRPLDEWVSPTGAAAHPPSRIP